MRAEKTVKAGAVAAKKCPLRLDQKSRCNRLNKQCQGLTSKIAVGNIKNS